MSGQSAPGGRRLRPIFCLLIALIAGILVGPAAALPWGFLLGAGGLLWAINLFIPQRNPVAAVLLLCLPFALMGAGLEQRAAVPSPDDVCRIAGGPSVWVEGAVASEVQAHPSGAVSLTLAARAVNDFQTVRPADGLIAVTITDPGDLTLLPGDPIAVRGRIETPESVRNPNGFDDRAFLARRGIHSALVVRRTADVRATPQAGSAPRIRRLSEALRTRILDTAASRLGADDAALLSALLLAVHSGLTADLQDALSRTGALYVLSVSGLHLSALAWAVSALLARVGVPRRPASVIAVALLYLFVFAAGGGTPGIRAAIVLTVLLLAPFARRMADPLNSLAVAAFVLLTCQPLSLFDPGFQLSFAAIGALLLWLPPLRALLLPWEPGESRIAAAVRYLLSALLAGVVAQIGSWPLTAYHFNELSFIAPVASVLLAPLSVLLLLAGLGAILLTALLPVWATAPLWSAVAAGLHLLRGLVFAFSALPFAAASIVSPPLAGVFLYYALLAGAAPFVRRKALRATLFTPRQGRTTP